MVRPSRFSSLDGMMPEPEEEHYPTPLLRRRGVLGTIALVAAAALVLITLMSTCTSPSRTPVPTTITVPTLVALPD
jgi:hypothetical protein